MRWVAMSRGWQQCFGNAVMRSSWAEGWRPSWRDVRHIDRAEEVTGDTSGLLVYHHSIGWEKGLGVLEKARVGESRSTTM
jgi:hypothetical protein